MLANAAMFVLLLVIALALEMRDIGRRSGLWLSAVRVRAGSILAAMLAIAMISVTIVVAWTPVAVSLR